MNSYPITVPRILDRRGPQTKVVGRNFGGIVYQCGRCYEPLTQTPEGAYCLECSTSDRDFGGGRPLYLLGAP